MHKRVLTIIAVVLAASLLAACDGVLDDNVATANAFATLAAGGSVEGMETNTPEPEPTATEIPNFFDITGDPNALLVQTWGRIYGLGSGEEFTIIATERQVGTYIVQRLQQGGFIEFVRGGSAQIGDGQIRLDLALEDEDADFGAGSFTFQPTLASGQVRINPQPADIGGLDLPGRLITGVGDAIHTALTGAPNNSLSEVTLNLIALDNNTMRVEGVTR